MEVGVTNPIPGMTRIAVAPFFNLSQEQAVDGRRFALAYFAELQKVPGYQVIPVGIAEQAIFDNQLEMNRPADALRLARILNVDAVVVGAVTDYTPYYPPRIGMQVSWYSPRPWNFALGPPIDPNQRDEWRDAHKAEKDRLKAIRKAERKAERKEDQRNWKLWNDSPESTINCETGDCEPTETIVRGQSPTDDRFAEFLKQADAAPSQPRRPTATPASTARVHTNAVNSIEVTAFSSPESTQNPFANQDDSSDRSRQPSIIAHRDPLAQRQGSPQATEPPLPTSPGNGASGPVDDLAASEMMASPSLLKKPSLPTDAKPSGMMPSEEGLPPSATEPAVDEVLVEFNPYEPLMSYTRMFDGADADLVAKLRDYVELSGDLRSGGWEAYLHRSEDFIRFTAHLMIEEMLRMHGGEGKRRIVFKLRKNL